MGTVGQRINGVLSVAFPEKRLFIQSGRSTRYLRLTPLSQFLSTTAASAALCWMAVATATVVIDRVAAGNDARAVVVKEAYQARLEELAAERDQRGAEARSAQSRFQVAMEQVSRQQTAILQSVEERRELSTALDLMRQRLEDAVAQRDSVTAAHDRLVAQITEVNDSLTMTASGEDLTETLDVVSNALAEAVAVRDAATADRTALTQQVADLELQVQVTSERQDEMLNQIEEAIAVSFGPLEKMFEKASIDVDGLLADVRTNYSGTGGPLLGTTTVSTRNVDGASAQRWFQQADARPRPREPDADRRGQGAPGRAGPRQLPLHQPLRLPQRSLPPRRAHARRRRLRRAAWHAGLHHRRRRGHRPPAGRAAMATSSGSSTSSASRPSTRTFQP